jgi:hypothetical protein
LVRLGQGPSLKPEAHDKGAPGKLAENNSPSSGTDLDQNFKVAVHTIPIIPITFRQSRGPIHLQSIRPKSRSDIQYYRTVSLMGVGVVVGEFNITHHADVSSV